MKEQVSESKQEGFFSDANELKLLAYRNLAFSLAKQSVIRFISFLISVSPTIILYIVLSYIFLSIYDVMGFERTIIILSVIVINYALRNNKRRTEK